MLFTEKPRGLFFIMLILDIGCGKKNKTLLRQAGRSRILERRLTFGGNLLLDNLGRMFAAISLDFYEKHLAWVFPARNIICRLSVLKSRGV
jgi:hypothetical protein